MGMFDGTSMKSQTAAPFSGASQPGVRNLSVLRRTEVSSFGIFLNLVSLCLLLGKILFTTNFYIDFTQIFEFRHFS
jgi:hypothetical protein